MKPNATKSNSNQNKINKNMHNTIQYITLHYNIQYNITNTIIQMRKKQIKPKETTDPKPNEM